MRIGLYGMPTAGKSHILDRIDFMEVAAGSKLLREHDPEFDTRDKNGQEQDRKALVKMLMKKQSFIMDGHYAFGDEIVFTEDDGKYDVFLYLYISPEILKERMSASEKNLKYMKFDISAWQMHEIDGLREYCHRNNKDFYVIDNPPQNYFDDIAGITGFIHEIVNGYSCLSYAKRCAGDILRKSMSGTIILLDGDRTLTIEDSSQTVFAYKTHLYDGNFYTGYQAWKQYREFQQYAFNEPVELPVCLNDKLRDVLTKNSFILTSGHERVWNFISGVLGIDCYYGAEMAAETKFFITKFLQDAGKQVIAYGDSMNDYFMLRQADEGYLVRKQDGSISRSLKGRNMEGLNIV